MPYNKPQKSPSNDVMFRVAATVWSNHLVCRVRRCRRECRCLGRMNRFGMPLCAGNMKIADLTDMLDFFGDTAKLATPDLLAAELAMATTDEEREMIAFRRRVFLYYHQELAKAGLEEPLGAPFVEG
ncbi:hypothetical protein [Rhizobium herbae]